MSFLYLALAVALEVVATSALKASEQFTRLWPSVLVVLGYGCAFYLLSLCLRTMPLGIMYAVWSGLGVVLITIVGWLVTRLVWFPIVIYDMFFSEASHYPEDIS